MRRNKLVSDHTSVNKQTSNGRVFQGHDKQSTRVQRDPEIDDLIERLGSAFTSRQQGRTTGGGGGGDDGDGDGDDGEDGPSVQSSHHFAAERKPKKPALYNGKTSWLDYLVHFEMISEINGWNSQQMALELATSLRDNALAVLGDIDRRDQRNYACLVAALTTRFEPSNYAEVYRAELKSRIRDKNESLCVLAQDIKRLVRKVYTNVPRQVRDELCKDGFIDALNDEEMEWAVHQNKPYNVDDALQYAMEFEAFRKSRKQRNPARPVRLAGVSPENDDEKDSSKK